MKKIRIGINGFGRIGRIAARIILARENVELVAINSRADAKSHAYLFKYDSTYGTLQKTISAVQDALLIDGKKVSVFMQDAPIDIPWSQAGVDIVIDATGKYQTSVDLRGHIDAGSKYVVLSAPAKDDTKTLVLGVNERLFNSSKDKIISNSSCTTNCLATTLSVLHENFEVVRGFMTTTHAVTDSQNLLDNSHKKEVRLGRASLASLIPASTGSAQDIGKLFPELKGKIICQAIRVPLLTVSIINLIVEVKKVVTVEKVNQAYDKSEQTNLKNILEVAKEQLVSRDFTGNPASSIVDPYLTKVLEGNLIHVSAWYDNEWGYTSRLVDIVEYIGKNAERN